MKIWKKALSFLLALGMTASFAACGDKKEPAGEKLEGEGAWAAAWEATFSATNMTVDIKIRSEESNMGGSGFTVQEGTVKLADGKVYVYGEMESEWDFGEDEQGKGSSTLEYYLGLKDGQLYQWHYYKQGDEWQEFSSSKDVETYATGYGVISDVLGPEIGRYDYVAWESTATYDGGVYTMEIPIDGVMHDYKVKFVDGKIYSIDILSSISYDGGGSTDHLKYVFEYGNTSVGELPITKE